MKKDPRIIRTVQNKRGQYALDLGQGRWIAYGYTWSSPNGKAFTPRNAIGSPVSVYLKTERECRVIASSSYYAGQASTAAQADKIGRKGIKQHILPLLDSVLDSFF